MKNILCTLLLLCCCASSQAQWQEGLDPYFGNKGVKTSGSPLFGYSKQFINGILQPDGKILALTITNIARYNSDGSADKSFGTDGIVKFDTLRDNNDIPLVGFNSYRFYALGQQMDGKIVIVGDGDIYPTPGNMILVLRLHSNGTIDSSFGRYGIVCNPVLGSNTATNLNLLPDGKILISGKVADDDFQLLVRYHSNGTIDSSFGTNGKAVNIAVSAFGRNDMYVLPDGRITLAYDFFGVARYLPNGSLDTSFNHTGMAASFFSGFASPISTAMALRPDGKIWIAGNPIFDVPTPFILGRLNANGSIDSSFGGIGYREYAWDTGDQNKCRDMLLLPDGKLILGGRVMNKATKQYNFGLMRIKPDGVEDSSFGLNARLLTQTNVTDGKYKYDDLKKLLLQSDNKILGLGNSLDKELSSTIVRYYAEGKTAIKELPQNSETAIKFYPNPASNTIFIESKDKIKQTIIYNLLGVAIKQNTNGNPIDISLLPKGAYIIRILTDNNTEYHQTFIKSQ